MSMYHFGFIVYFVWFFHNLSNMGGVTDGTIFPVKYSPFSNFQLIFNVCIGSFDVKHKLVLQKTNAIGNYQEK